MWEPTWAAGLVVYDGGEFVYSNHATDPISGRLCNAFDLVRIHLYGERDELTDMRTITEFAEKSGAALTVMPGGEHWFHTDEQLRFLDRWISA